MDGNCQISFGELSGATQWSFDGAYLTVAPEGGSPRSYPVREMKDIAGDGYTLRLTVPGTDFKGSELVLSELGEVGPNLLQTLRRYWLRARADVLRLGGSGEGKSVSGRVAGLETDAPESFRGSLYEDVLVLAREGRDLEPVFLAHTEAVTLDQAAHAVRLREWPERELVFSKLAGRTQDFVSYLRVDRGLLAEESGSMLAVVAPKLSAARRSVLAGKWMPGRLLRLDEMDGLCPGFDRVFRDEWLPRLVRHREGEHLLDWAPTGSAWLGCTREPAGDDERALWMLCADGDTWFLEALSGEEHSTYCFVGGEEVPVLASRLLCAPQFLREALYSPLADLTGKMADLAIPARDLHFLAELRSRFRGRTSHQTFEAWHEEIEELARLP